MLGLPRRRDAQIEGGAQRLGHVGNLCPEDKGVCADLAAALLFNGQSREPVRRVRVLTNERTRIHLPHMSTNHEHVMASTVLSVRVPEELKEQLDYLSNATKRSKAYLAAEALTEYVHRNAWKAKELHEALAEADKGEFISHEAMTAWADSLGTSNELRPPEPDVFLKR